MANKNIKHLDCTLRDGGYYNLWDFSEELINEYLNSMKEAKVDTIELGFRSIRNEGFKGACAFTSDEFLDKLNLGKNFNISVMVNASDLLILDSLEGSLERIFPNEAKNSHVDVVRIAAHFIEFEKVLPASQWLNKKGFKVMYNLMQISDRTEIEIKSILEKASKYPIDVFYFADSTGSIDNNRTKSIVKLIKRYWKKSIGFHAHDNLGLALSNTLIAIDNGVDWVDSTVLGMGRGPGNTKTELLALEICKTDVNLSSLSNLIYKYFIPLQKSYNWGTNLFYYLSGKYGIHPTFIQEMLNDKRYKKNELLSIIERIAKNGGKNFSKETLQSARDFLSPNVKGTWSPKEIFNNRDVLILGSGPSLVKYKSAIEDYIIKNKPLVLSLNIKEDFNFDLINFIVACHPFRILSDFEKYKNIKTPFIMPLNQLKENNYGTFKLNKIFNYGVLVQNNIFKFNSKDCAIPVLDVFLYALAIANSGNVNNIFLAGFDGFDFEDARFLETKEIIEKYYLIAFSKPLISITPSKYPIKTKSVFSTMNI